MQGTICSLHMTVFNLLSLMKGAYQCELLYFITDSVYTFRVLTVLMSGYSERIVIRSWYSVLPRMDSVYTFV